MAEEQEIEGWKDMERDALITALKPKEDPEETEDTEETKEESEKDKLMELTVKKVKKIAKKEKVDIKGLKTKEEIVDAILAGAEEGGPRQSRPEIPTSG